MTAVDADEHTAGGARRSGDMYRTRDDWARRYALGIVFAEFLGVLWIVEGAQLFLKRMFDIFGSGALIIVLSPLLLLVALAVKASSRGPVLFRQERVGHQGRPFRMLKFRSMVANAEDLLPSLLDRQRDAGNAVMFKLREDPRVTRVGRFIRRYSIDELPQLFNVFGGSMSLVGPRPPLLREVATYDRKVHRKFLVKPGVTGLWQVNGRSSLNWDESVRLDLFYVENWSLMGDIIILWRTLKAVLGRTGAYLMAWLR